MAAKKSYLSNYKSPFRDVPFGRFESNNNRFSVESKKELSDFSVYYTNQDEKFYIHQSSKFENFRSPGHYLDFKQPSFNIAYSPFQNKTEKFGKLGKDNATADNKNLNKVTWRRDKDKARISEFDFQECLSQRERGSLCEKILEPLRNKQPVSSVLGKKEVYQPKELLMRISEQIDILGSRLEDIDVNVEPEWDDEIRSSQSEFNSIQSLNDSFKKLKRKRKEEITFFEEFHSHTPGNALELQDTPKINLTDDTQGTNAGFSIKYLHGFYDKLVKLSTKVEKISYYNNKAGRTGIAKQLSEIDSEINQEEEMHCEKRRKYFCKYCSKIFPSGSGLGGHMSRVHKGISKEFQRRKMTRDRRVIARERKSYLQKSKK